MNPVKGEVSFVADERTYTLKFSIDAICALEAETSKGIIALTTDLQNPEKMTITVARQILWAGLREHHPDITLKEAGELIPLAGGLSAIMALTAQAMSSAFPRSKEPGSRPQKAGSPKNGIGPRSTVAGAGSDGKTSPSGERHHAKSS